MWEEWLGLGLPYVQWSTNYKRGIEKQHLIRPIDFASAAANMEMRPGREIYDAIESLGPIKGYS